MLGQKNTVWILSTFKPHICSYYRATQRLMAAGPARPIAPPDYALQQVAFHLGFKGAFYNYVDQILPIIDHLPTPCWY